MIKSLLLPFFFFSMILSIHAQFSDPLMIDDSVSSTVRNLIVFDVDNDNLNDIIVSHYLNDVYWYKNNGNGFNEAQAITSSVSIPYHLDFKDANSDGFQDLLVTNNHNNNGGAILFLNNNGGESWTEVVIDDSLEIGTFKSFFLDVENDGDFDIIVNSDFKINLYLNDGTASFSPAITIESMSEYYSMTVNDFTNDGFTDLVVNSGVLGTILFTNNTDGTFNEPSIIASGISIFLSSSDIDNDNHIDVLRGNPNDISEIQLYTNNSGNFDFNHNEPNSDALDVTNVKFHLSDIDLDGFKDIIQINDHKLYWKQNLQNKTFSDAHLIDQSFQHRVAFSGDLNMNGDQEVIFFAWDEIENIFKLGYITMDHIMTSKPHLTEEEITIYPNPAQNYLNIQGNIGAYKIGVYDLLGQHILDIQTNSTDISHLNEGVYFLKYNPGSKPTFTTKFIIKR